MKWIKDGNLPKLVAFFIVAITLSCTVAYAAGGFKNMEDNDSPLEEDTPAIDLNNPPDEETTPVIKPVPEYLHYITGNEIDAEQSYKKPLCITLDASSPLYALSYSYLVLEVPTDGGETRMLAYTDNALTLGKIGSISPTRDYISQFTAYFGGILLARGNDGIESTTGSFYNPNLDISEHIGYHYTEHGSYFYTNGDLLEALIKNTQTDTVNDSTYDLPYSHVDYFADPVTGASHGEYVLIKYSSYNTTEFLYSTETQKYQLNKNGNAKTDPLNNASCEYDNVFILSADSTIYETEEYIKTSLKTNTSGKGIYLTNGTYSEITWTVSAGGSMIFQGLNGEELIANRGTTYISYVKSCEYKNIIIE